MTRVPAICGTAFTCGERGEAAGKQVAPTDIKSLRFIHLQIAILVSLSSFVIPLLFVKVFVK